MYSIIYIYIFKDAFLWSNITILWPSRKLLPKLCFYNCKHKLAFSAVCHSSVKFVIGSSYCKWGWGVENKMTCTLGLQLRKKKKVYWRKIILWKQLWVGLVRRLWMIATLMFSWNMQCFTSNCELENLRMSCALLIGFPGPREI